MAARNPASAARAGAQFSLQRSCLVEMDCNSEARRQTECRAVAGAAFLILLGPVRGLREVKTQRGKENLMTQEAEVEP